MFLATGNKAALLLESIAAVFPVTLLLVSEPWDWPGSFIVS